MNQDLVTRCPFCLRTAHQLNISEKRVQKGDFKPHIVLCRGRDISGRPLGIEDRCLMPGCASTSQRPTAAAWKIHYSRSHKVNLLRFQDLRSLRRCLQPWHAPDFEMNGDWGYFITKKSPIKEFEILRNLWSETMDPLKFKVEFQHQVLHDYRRLFTRVFEATPISWHAHASDAWAVLPSVIAMLEEDSPTSSIKMTQTQRDRCRLATFEAQMLSFHGPLAHGGTGVKPRKKSTCLGDTQIIRLDDTSDKGILLKIFAKLSRSGHIAVVLEMVRQRDGRVVSPQQWNTICECCEETGLYLAVDEVQTAWRCGAPFVHLLPQYSRHRPSFVIFGKAIGISGLAVHWNGIYVKRLCYGEPADTDQFLHLWDHKSSRVMDPNDALRSWGYILLSEKEQWCERSLRIGVNLRKVLCKLWPGVEVGGMGSLIYIPADIAQTMDIVGAAVDGTSVRWLPYLDEGLDNVNQVYELFSAARFEALNDVARSNTSFAKQRCISCGDFVHGETYGPCERCSGYLCSDCVDYSAHIRHEEGKCVTLGLRIELS